MSEKLGRDGGEVNGTICVKKNFDVTENIFDAQLLVSAPNGDCRAGIAFYIDGAPYGALIYMAGNGDLYARWSDGTEKKIISRV